MTEKKKTATKKATAKKAPVKKSLRTMGDLTKKTEAELVKEARALWGPLANKTRAYLEFVNKNKADMPEEYLKAKNLIKRYL